MEDCLPSRCSEIQQLSSLVRHLQAPIILKVVVVHCGSPQIELNQQRSRPETGDRSGAGGAEPGWAWQSVQSSPKNAYGTAVFRLLGLAAVAQSRAGLKTEGTDDCEAWMCTQHPKKPLDNAKDMLENIQWVSVASIEGTFFIPRCSLIRASSQRWPQTIWYVVKKKP